MANENWNNQSNNPIERQEQEDSTIKNSNINRTESLEQSAESGNGGDEPFDYWNWISNSRDKFSGMLKAVLPDKGDEFIDMCDKYADKVTEYMAKFDDKLLTPFDVIEWIVNSIDAVIDYVKYRNQDNEGNKQEKLYNYQLDEWIDYDEVDDKAKVMGKKFKDLLDARKMLEEDIDISKGLPSLEEMFSDDLAYDFFKGLVGSDNDKEIVGSAFYCEAPSSFTPGYHSDNTFILECTPSALVDLTKEMHINAVDGDTYHFTFSDLSETGKFNMKGTEYESFKDYCEKNNLSSKTLQVRCIGIDCPELPHYNGLPMKESQIKKMTIKEAKSKGTAVYRKYNYKSGSNGEPATVTERNLDTECSWYYDSANKKYFEISEFNKWDYYDSSSALVNSIDYQCNIIVSSDESELDTLAEGYRARTVAYSVLKNSERIILKLDANGAKANKTTGVNKLYYNHWWNADKAVSAMIDQWQNAMANNAQLTRLSYSPFGTDGYGRFVGEVYCYTNIKGKMMWVNLNKYVMHHVEATKFYTVVENSPELSGIFGSNAKAFDLWSYNKDNLKYLDSLEESTKESYQGRLKFHKHITGIDFLAFRNCTMMIGDTLFLIPPTAIRNNSGVEYEKVNILCGKGSMVKGVSAREQYLEIDLYFYDEYGINGIPYEETLPNGQKMTYYMNGLRSLIAQFKVAPYLPIENQYVNDVLGIEAVSLVNLNVNTVEGFPRLLQATLTLRDFNYRIYMPDIPFDYGLKVSEDGETVEAQIESMNQITEMNPIFAKCFHWEIFRYYYQRAIAKGSLLATFQYNTKEYNEQYYQSRNALKPLNFCNKSDTISFYVPSEDWLSMALKVKKDRDYYGQMPITVELTEAGQEFMDKVGATSQYLKVNNTHAIELANNYALINTGVKDTVENKNIFNTGKTTMLSYIGTGSKTALKDMIMEIANNIESCGALKYDSTDEEYNATNQILTWKIHFKITGMNLSSEDLLSIKEKLKDILGLGSSNEVFKNNRLTVTVKASAVAETAGLVHIKFNPSMTVSSPEISAMASYLGGVDPNPDIENIYDYLNPAAMEFVPYIEEVPLQGLAFNMSNTFTEMHLKMMDGSAPQYMGSSDLSIELRIITDNSLVISMLNVLPSHSMNIAKQYRRILNCWPVRVRQNVLNMAGINEVLIDSIQIENMDGFPGVYDIRMRMTSVDRVMRNREMMMKLDSREDVTTLSDQNICTYFDLQDTLAMAETYPDLDIPTLYELNQIGYRFLKYAGRVRTYPDPDFYMVYSFQYTAQIIKKAIKDVFIKEGILKTDDEYAECNKSGNIQSMFADSTGQKLITELEAVTGIKINKLNGNAFYYTDAVNSADGVEERKRYSKIETDPEFAGNVDVITAMTLYDVEEGWQIKPGWKATICPAGLEKAVRNCELSNLCSKENVEKEEQVNSTYTDIFKKRKEIIELIDKILSKPMPMSGLDPYGINGLNLKMKRIDWDLHTAICKFYDDGDVKKLFKLMCPTGELEFPDRDTIEFWTNECSKFEKPFLLQFIKAYMFAAGCAQTGEQCKLAEKDWEAYFPQQYLISNGEIVKNDGTNDYSSLPAVPNVAIETATNPKYAKTKKQAIEQGFAFGMYQIKKETKEEIKARIKPESQVDYLGDGKTMKFYDDYQDGFIDPYYNKLSSDSKELKQYIEIISKFAPANAYAFLRITLVYLRKQIIEGLIISDLDLIATLYQDEIAEDVAEVQIEAAKVANMSMLSTVTQGGYIDPMQYQQTYEMLEEVNYGDKTGEGTEGTKDNEQLQMLKDLPESYAQSFCARMILPFAEAAAQTLTGPDITFKDLLYKRKLNDLNMLSATLLGASNTSGQLITKFMMALSGNVINSKNTDSSAGTTSDSQKVLNFLMKEAFTECAEDPQYYILHSFYDMLVNDKRGRLLRAFPTYYVVFVDEGRRIGSWKLFDNFYNMSAIADLTVTKSRKIPTDTCSFTMTNMFGSYASEYDNTSKVNYVDVYSLRDTFTSIFSPRQYITKEAALKRRKENTEQTILKPGVRIHIRMGYGSDAAGLPVVFNGKIAEIDVGDVVTVIGQGDGTELCNPLNALGDIDATNLIESQSWCTLFKDIRGSLARGGLSPRNLLSQILTAEHGGLMKNIVRSYTQDAYFGDNPFGIYHFGDKRFGEIFTEGEPTQNLYEVVDGNLLAGMNTLYQREGSMSCSPTINTTIQDKTFWDLLIMCAYSGVGYIGAIRDFGFRSTVCLCKRNQYYAYDYTTVDGKYIEKRKPFQQFHYYDSYTDIIYNSIKASEKNMKTNATGIWEGTDVIWGSEQKTCGPIYLDMNIYPEYQKSMTVDTGLVGVGNGGIDIPFVTHYAEDWNLNANADKVNKTLAERITLNTLRESVSNMYTGEICVIGDPSVKPYDRISIVDSYEDMCGQCEVEAVVFSMNAATGFTTTIYPDLIVRQDDPHEIATQQILGNVIAGFVTTVTARIAVIAPLARVSSKLMVGASKFFTGLFAASGVEGGLGAGATAKICSFFKINKAGGFLKGLGSFLGSVSATTWVWMVVIAATVFIATQNAKSSLTRWIRNIQALDVYPLMKNQRPYIAGMNGHKGSVVGYGYTEDDAQDSIQGIVTKCVEVLDKNAVSGFILSIFLNRSEYNATVSNWSNTLTTLNGATPINTVEGVYQNALGEVSSEFRNRSASIQMLRTKYRLVSFNTNNGSDSTYLKYRILGVTTSKDIDPQKVIEYRSDSVTNIYETSIFTNKNLLDLYPIEDDIDIKKAIAGTHPNIKEFKIAHSTGPITVSLPFESGARVIRFIAETNPTSKLSGYPILDMPMIQEDALYILKLLLNDQNLSNVKLEFTSGVRVNDIRTWKNTGYVFELHTNDATQLTKALENVKQETSWTMNGVEYPAFAYQKNGRNFVISVYPEASNSVNNNSGSSSASSSDSGSNNVSGSSNNTAVKDNSSSNNVSSGNANSGNLSADNNASSSFISSTAPGSTYPNLPIDYNNSQYVTNRTDTLVPDEEFIPPTTEDDLLDNTDE